MRLSQHDEIVISECEVHAGELVNLENEGDDVNECRHFCVPCDTKRDEGYGADCVHKEWETSGESGE